MTDHNGEGRVYFVDPLRQTMLGRIRQDIANVDEQMRETQRVLDAVNAAQTVLGEIQLVLEHMHTLALKAASDPAADRPALADEFEKDKRKIDDIAERYESSGQSLPKSNLQHVQKAVAAVDAIINRT